MDERTEEHPGLSPDQAEVRGDANLLPGLEDKGDPATRNGALGVLAAVDRGNAKVRREPANYQVLKGNLVIDPDTQARLAAVRIGAGILSKKGAKYDIEMMKLLVGVIGTRYMEFLLDNYKDPRDFDLLQSNFSKMPQDINSAIMENVKHYEKERLDGRSTPPIEKGPPLFHSIQHSVYFLGLCIERIGSGLFRYIPDLLRLSHPTEDVNDTDLALLNEQLFIPELKEIVAEGKPDSFNLRKELVLLDRLLLDMSIIYDQEGQKYIFLDPED